MRPRRREQRCVLFIIQKRTLEFFSVEGRQGDYSQGQGITFREGGVGGCGE